MTHYGEGVGKTKCGKLAIAVFCTTDVDVVTCKRCLFLLRNCSSGADQ